MWEKRKWVRGKVRGKKKKKESLSACALERDRVCGRKGPTNIVIDNYNTKFLIDFTNGPQNGPKCKVE